MRDGDNGLEKEIRLYSYIIFCMELGIKYRVMYKVESVLLCDLFLVFIL